MRIFNKSEKENINSKDELKLHNDKKSIEEEGTKCMKYTELLYEEFNSKVNPLKNKKKEIENAINEALSEIKENGSNNGRLDKIIAGLREKEKNIQNEINQVSQKYVVDPELLNIAFDIDNVDMNNRGMDLLYSIVPKVNEIVSILNEAQKCYPCEYYAPYVYSSIKGSMEGAVMLLNSELPKLHKANKNELIKKFNERMTAVQTRRRRIKDNEDKYSSLLD